MNPLSRIIVCEAETVHFELWAVPPLVCGIFVVSVIESRCRPGSM